MDQHQIFSSNTHKAATPTSRSNKRIKRKRKSSATHSKNNNDPSTSDSPQRRRRKRRGTASSVFVHEALFIIHSSRRDNSHTSIGGSAPAVATVPRSASQPHALIRRTSSLSMHISSNQSSFRASIEISHSVPVCSGRARARASTNNAASTSKHANHHVHFSTDFPNVMHSQKDTDAKMMSRTDPNQYDASLQWYSPSEMSSFRRVAFEAGRKLHIEQLENLAGRRPHNATRVPSSIQSASRNDENSSSESEKEEDDHSTYLKSRGLDYRSSLERQRNRRIGIRAVLECQRRLRNGHLDSMCAAMSGIRMSPEVHLALISAKCTRWSREAASLIGKRDFYEAYPELCKQTDESKGSNPYAELSSLDHLRPFPAPAGKALQLQRCHTAPAAVCILKEEEEDSDEEGRRRMLGQKRNKRCSDKGRTNRKRHKKEEGQGGDAHSGSPSLLVR